MAWLFSNIAAGVVRWATVVILSAVCLAIGFSPVEYLQAFFLSPPDWVATPFLRIGMVMVGLGILIGHYFVDRRWARVRTKANLLVEAKAGFQAELADRAEESRKRLETLSLPERIPSEKSGAWTPYLGGADFTYDQQDGLYIERDDGIVEVYFFVSVSKVGNATASDLTLEGLPATPERVIEANVTDFGGVNLNEGGGYDRLLMEVYPYGTGARFVEAGANQPRFSISPTDLSADSFIRGSLKYRAAR